MSTHTQYEKSLAVTDKRFCQDLPAPARLHAANSAQNAIANILCLFPQERFIVLDKRYHASQTKNRQIVLNPS